MPTDLNGTRIFVQIASYRDPECQWTIKDLFDKASRPERISVGISAQIVPEEDRHCFEIRTRPDQCRWVISHALEARGCAWARAQGLPLWQGEEYTLQIDSHTRFVPGWDEKLFGLIKKCPTAPAVLSTYAPTYEPPDKLGQALIRVLRPREFDDHGVLLLGARNVDKAPPSLNPFCSGHFLFGPAEILAAVPHDPYVYHYAEEIDLSVRLWTHGFDIYSPNEIILYHRFARAGRPLHWGDNPKWSRMAQLSGARMRHLLCRESCVDSEALRDIDAYGLGQKRSLAEYEAFAGIDFRNQLINGKTPDEHEMARPAQERRTRNTEVFDWKRQEERSTAGSKVSGGNSLRHPAALRAELPKLFADLGIEILADAGCGDFEWMSKISEQLRFYLGYDCIDNLIVDLRKQHWSRPGHFFNVNDVTVDLLPRCDAILCRDVLSYYPLSVAKATLKLFKESGSRYLITTTYVLDRNETVRLGYWHPIALTAPPFDLPPPHFAIAEPGQPPKSLGIWLLADLPC